MRGCSRCFAGGDRVGAPRIAQLTHLIKQLVNAATTPFALALLLALIGVIARLLGRRRAATFLWAAAAFLVYGASVNPVANALLWPLESRYPPLLDIRDLPVKDIVVLGSSYQPHDGIPSTAALGDDGLVRIAEALRLMHQIEGARLIVSGGAVKGGTPSAEGYAKFADELGVEPNLVVKLDSPLDTDDEARRVFALLGTSPFILVTSAYHMPRAVLLMHRAGAAPIPAPTGQFARRYVDYGLRAWIPNSASLRRSEHAIHEYLGMAIAN